MAYKPTDEQQAVLDTFVAGDNGSVKAYAGAGKTSTLVGAALLRPNARIIFTAFNKKIIQDSAKKFGRNVRCQTTHSLATHVAHADGGWRWNRMKAPRVYGRKLATLLAVNDPIPLDGGRIVHPSRLASLAVMMVDRWANSGDDEIGWWHLPSVPGLDDRDTRRLIGEALVPAARRAWADITNPRGVLRYTHNYYRKEYALTHPRIDADAIFVDEAQDSAGVLVRLIQDQAEHGTQIITVGDSFQAINGWTGAVDAMDKFGGVELYITQSFRFGTAIAEEANKWLELLGAPKPLRGNDAVPSRLITDMPQPDAVLCRTNGAVVKEVIDRLTAGQRVSMLGDPKEITDFTRGARDLQDKGWSGHHDLMAFGSWGQVQEYVDHDDAGADMKVLVDLIDKHGVDEIEDAMGRLAPAHRADVVLSTAHKCKGAEWDAVRIGGDFKAPKPDEITKRLVVSKEAAMLNYVAVTRAKVALHRGSLAWVDEALDDHRETKGTRHPAPAPAPAADAEEPVMIGPQDDPDVIVRVDTTAKPLAPGDKLGPAVVIETADGQLATVQPLDLDSMPGRPPVALRILTEAARTPLALDTDETPQWVKDGLPGSGWTVEEYEAFKARQSAAFDEGLRRSIAAADRAKDAPEADVDPLIAETAPAQPKPEEVEPCETCGDHCDLVLHDAPALVCGAEHRVWLNTACRLAPHGPEVLHADLGLEWDDSKCKTLGVAPVNA
jgi:hypothetical protein